MGKSRGPAAARIKGNDRSAGRCRNAGSFDQNRSNLEAGAATRLKQKHPLPSVGDRFGELTVLDFVHGPAGGVKGVRVQCSCAAPPHVVFGYNLRKGASTRCAVCARKQSGYFKKNYTGYADIVPDNAHRRRLLNRIAACINRCHNPNDAGYRSYGGRGIHVHELWRKDRRAYLAHLITLPGWDQPELELDREDTDKGYEPGNLRFVTRHVNAGNRRKVAILQARITELEERLRHCQCGSTTPLHDLD